MKVAKPESPAQAIESLLIFDARSLSNATRQELLRILPELVHVRRAWKAHYLEHGCISCPKADEKAAIAARMRLKGYTWDEIFEIVAPNTDNTRRKRNLFRNTVYWKLEHPKGRAERNPNAYGSGGLCSACAARLYQRMRDRFRKAMEGRNLPQEIAELKDSLCRRYNAAQRLFNGEA